MLVFWYHDILMDRPFTFHTIWTPLFNVESSTANCFATFLTREARWMPCLVQSIHSILKHMHSLAMCPANQILISKQGNKHYWIPTWQIPTDILRKNIVWNIQCLYLPTSNMIGYLEFTNTQARSCVPWMTSYISKHNVIKTIRAHVYHEQLKYNTQRKHSMLSLTTPLLWHWFCPHTKRDKHAVLLECWLGSYHF